MSFVIRNLPMKFQVDPPINTGDMLQENVSVTDRPPDQPTDRVKYKDAVHLKIQTETHTLLVSSANIFRGTK